MALPECSAGQPIPLSAVGSQPSRVHPGVATQFGASGSRRNPRRVHPGLATRRRRRIKRLGRVPHSRNPDGRMAWVAEQVPSRLGILVVYIIHIVEHVAIAGPGASLDQTAPEPVLRVSASALFRRRNAVAPQLARHHAVRHRQPAGELPAAGIGRIESAQ